MHDDYDRRTRSVASAERRFKRAAKMLVLLGVILVSLNWLLTEKIDAARRECIVDRRDAETKLDGICSDERRGGLRSPAECEYHRDVARRRQWQCILAKMVNNAFECPMGACNCFGVNCTLVFFSFVLIVVATISVATCCLCGMSVGSFVFATMGRNQLPWRHTSSSSSNYYAQSMPPAAIAHQHHYPSIAASPTTFSAPIPTHSTFHLAYAPSSSSLTHRHLSSSSSPQQSCVDAQSLDHEFSGIKVEHVD